MSDFETTFRITSAKKWKHLTCKLAKISLTPKMDNEDCKRKTKESQATLDKYLYSFAATPNNTCPGCGSKLGVSGVGDMIASICGITEATFQYGIVYGEGNCSNCCWPCRANHKTDVCSWEAIYPYHPDFLEVK